jgi:hypothetical protein
MRSSRRLAQPVAQPVRDAASGRGLRVLLDIQLAIQSSDGSSWESAVPWACLRAAGLAESQVHELLAACYLDHCLETTTEQSAGRTFTPAGLGALAPRSCLLLTERGIASLRELMAPAQAPTSSSAQPIWDGKAGELSCQGWLVKRFRHDAANQRLVLDAFQRAGWSRCISNPFRERGMPSPKKCLHRTIEGLNEGQNATIKGHCSKVSAVGCTPRRA